MRKTRALVALGFALLVTPMLMGATISFTAINANPGGQASVLAAKGTIALGANENRQSVIFTVTVKNSNPVQVNGVGATSDDTTWSASMSAAANTYNPCNARLIYVDANGLMQQATDQNVTDQVVK